MVGFWAVFMNISQNTEPIGARPGSLEPPWNKLYKHIYDFFLISSSRTTDLWAGGKLTPVEPCYLELVRNFFREISTLLVEIYLFS